MITDFKHWGVSMREVFAYRHVQVLGPHNTFVPLSHQPDQSKFLVPQTFRKFQTPALCHRELFLSCVGVFS